MARSGANPSLDAGQLRRVMSELVNLADLVHNIRRRLDRVASEAEDGSYVASSLFSHIVLDGPVPVLERLHPRIVFREVDEGRLRWTRNDEYVGIDQSSDNDDDDDDGGIEGRVTPIRSSNGVEFLDLEAEVVGSNNGDVQGENSDLVNDDHGSSLARWDRLADREMKRQDQARKKRQDSNFVVTDCSCNIKNGTKRRRDFDDDKDDASGFGRRGSRFVRSRVM